MHPAATRTTAVRDRPLRIGINTLAAVPGRSGGDGTYVRTLVEHLAALDQINHYYLFVAPYNLEWFEFRQPNIHMVLCPVPNNFYLRVLWEQTVLALAVDRMSLDLFHATVNVAPALMRTPMILTIHDVFCFMPDTPMPPHLRLYWKVFRSWSARRAREIIAMSQTNAEEIHQLMRVPRQKVHVIYNGVNPRFHRRDREIARQTLGKRYGISGPFILWIGRPYANKNVERMIDAFALVRAQGETIQLVLVGPEGWQTAAMHAAIERHGLAQHIHSLGYVANEELPDFYAAAELFLMPSLKETFCFPILEAMATGTPVVTSTTSVLPEIAGDAAELVDPYRPEDIARGIRAVLHEPARREGLLERGIARAGLFAWQETARQTISRYDSATGRSIVNPGDVPPG